MLLDMLEMYKDAMESQDTPEMERLEKEFNQLGVDKYTLDVLMEEI